MQRDPALIRSRALMGRQARGPHGLALGSVSCGLALACSGKVVDDCEAVDVMQCMGWRSANYDAVRNCSDVASRNPRR